MGVVKRILLVLAVLGPALLVPAPAEAKELSSFTACGASGCTTVKDAASLRTLIRAVEAQGQPVSVPTPPPSPFLRLEFFIRGDRQAGPAFRQYYVPSRRVILVQTDPKAWSWVRADNVRSVLDRVVAGVTPFAAPTITRITLGAKRSLDANASARLFDAKATASTMPTEPDWVDVKIQTRGPSPWSTRAATLAYSPSTHVLWRGSEFVELPASLESSGDGSFPWALLFGGLGGAAVVVPAAIFARRRRAD
jgi:hypothetical protein